MFNFALDEGLVPEGFINPASRIRKFKEEKRDRWIQPGNCRGLQKKSKRKKIYMFSKSIWLYLSDRLQEE